MKTIGELIDAGVISRETKVSGNIPVSADGLTEWKFEEAHK